MKIYINKNKQQLGPFDEAKVLEMIRNGQLLPTDFGIKQGQADWQKLEVMFPPPQKVADLPIQPPPQYVPNVQLNSRISPTPQKSSSSKGLMFGLLGCGGLALFGIIGLFAFFSISPRSNTNNSSISNSSSPTASPEPTPERTKVWQKKDELFKMSPPQKIVPNPVIKPKVVVIEKTSDYETISPTIESVYSVDKYGIKEADYADNLDELQTLIQIKCTKGKEIGKYGPRMSYTSAYANVCTATIIDYKAATIITKKTFINAKRPVTIPDRGDYINEAPTAEIEKYLKGLPRE
jgi:GYF domain 2